MSAAKHRVRDLLWVTSAAALLLLAAALCLLTEAGFSRVVLPLAARRIGIEMTAGHGRLGLDGTVAVEGLELRDRRRGLQITIGRGLARVEPRSLLASARPSIELIDVQGASLEWRDEAAEAPPERRRPSLPSAPPALSELRIPFTLARARVADSAIRIRGAAGEERAVLAVASFTVDDLVPRKTANLKLTGTLAVAGGEVSAEAGDVELTGVIGQDEDGVVLGWKGAGKARLSAGGAEPLSVFVSSDSFRRDAAMDASFTLDSRAGPRRVGSLRATWHEQRPGQGAERSLNVEVKLGEVSDEILGPLLSALGRPRLENAKLDGGARFAFSAGDLTFDADAEAQVGGGAIRARLAKRAPGSEQPGAEIDVTARRVELAEIVPLVDPRDRHRVRGVIDLTAHFDAPGGDTRALVDAAEGRLEAQVERGRITGLGTLDVLAEHTGIDQLRELSDATLEAKIRLNAGIAGIERMVVESTAVRLFVSGSARTRGDLDLRVDTRLGPDLFRTVKNVPVAAALAAGADGLLELPVEVHVTGSFSAPRYTLLPHAPSATEPAGKAIEGIVDAGRRGAAGLVDRLLRRKDR